jgi:type I restriction enzyme M protein
MSTSIQQTSKQQLGQFYTSQQFSKILINNLSTQNPEMILELGAGRGSLLNAATQRWEKARLLTVDIDQENHKYLQQQFPNHIHLHYDALALDLPNELRQHVGSFGTAICNPPYLRPKWRKEFGMILEDAGLSDAIYSVREASADLLFMAQNLRMLEKNGELGIIVPDGYITAQKYTKLRKKLIENHIINSVIQLPRRIFSSTDAQTFIILLKKGSSTSKKIPLAYVDQLGNFSEKIEIELENAIQRMDYGYYDWENHSKRTSPRSKKLFLLSDLSKVSRGNLNKTLADKKNIQVLHTTDFKNMENLLQVHLIESNSELERDKYIIAKKGDIIISRVGRNLETQIAIIASGSKIISDCIFRIRAKEKYKKHIWESLTSETGQEWIRAHSRGVSALSITLTDINKFPIYL